MVTRVDVWPHVEARPISLNAGAPQFEFLGLKLKPRVGTHKCQADAITCHSSLRRARGPAGDESSSRRAFEREEAGGPPATEEGVVVGCCEALPRRLGNG